MKINFYYTLLISIAFASCQGEQKKLIAPDNQNDQIPGHRVMVSKKPIAVFDQKYFTTNPNSDLNDWRFSIKLYETSRMFWYKMVVVDRELEIKDTIVFPDLGMGIKPALKKGSEPNSCLVGFLDKADQFLEYKKVVSGNKGLTIKQTRSYYVSSKKVSR